MAKRPPPAGLDYGFGDEMMPMSERVIGALSARLMGKDVAPEDKQSDTLREQVRTTGRPFHYIAWQWPELVLTDPEEIDLFRASFTPQLLEFLTPELISVVTDPANPPLRLDGWQRVILAAFVDPTISEIYIKGCTGAGKGASTSIGFNMWYDIHNPSRTILTSESSEHAVKGIFGEFGYWRNKMAHPGPGELLSERVSHTHRHYVEIKNPKQTSGEAFSGAHGPHTIYGFDEATASPDIFFENAEKNATKIIALANPRTLFGRFRQAFEKLGDNRDRTAVCYGTLGRRLCVTVGGMDCMNVRHGRVKKAVAPMGGIDVLGADGTPQHFDEGQPLPPDIHAKVKALIQNQIDINQFLAICSQHDQRKVDVFAHGKFPIEDPQKQVIIAGWVSLAEKHWNPDSPIVPTCFGFDVAGSLNGDESVFAAGSDKGMADIHRWRINNVIDSAEEAIKIARDRYGINLLEGKHPVCVDMVGLGQGTGNALQKVGVWVLDFRGNDRAEVDPRTYENLRAESYALLGRRLNPQDFWRDQPWAIKPDEDLRRGLTAPEKVYAKDTLRFKITPKAELKIYLGGSPDVADAVVYLFHAVRTLHDLNQWFLQNSGPLTVWPQPEQPEDGSPPPPPETDLLKFLEDRYGSGRGVGGVGADGDDSDDGWTLNRWRGVW